MIHACRDADYISENALAISMNGGDMPMQQFLTLPSSVSNDHLSTSTMTNEANNSCKALPYIGHSSRRLNMVII